MSYIHVGRVSGEEEMYNQWKTSKNLLNKCIIKFIVEPLEKKLPKKPLETRRTRKVSAFNLKITLNYFMFHKPCSEIIKENIVRDRIRTAINSENKNKRDFQS